MHLQGGVAAPDRAEQKRLVKSPVGRKPTRENLVKHSGGDDVLRNIDTLPQQLQKWQEQCLTNRLQRQSHQELFHGTVVEAHPEQYFATVTQANRDREHLLNAAGWAASLRQPEVLDGTSTKIQGQQTRHAQCAGTEKFTSRTLRESFDTESVRTVGLGDILREMQLRSGSRAFCSAEDFETILLDFGVDFRHPLVSSITRVCPISDDGIISFAALYCVVDELQCASPLLSSTPSAVDSSTSKLEVQHSFQRSAAEDRCDGDEKIAEVTPGKAEAHSTAQARQTETAQPGCNEAVFSPDSSANLFPVHNFENTPLPQRSHSQEQPSSPSRVDVSVHLRHLSPGEKSKSASVSLLVEL